MIKPWKSTNYVRFSIDSHKFMCLISWSLPFLEVRSQNFFSFDQIFVSIFFLIDLHSIFVNVRYMLTKIYIQTYRYKFFIRGVIMKNRTTIITYICFYETKVTSETRGQSPKKGHSQFSLTIKQCNSISRSGEK